MKGRYKGCSMGIYGSILPGAAKVAHSAQASKLSKKARQRLKWMDWYFSHGKKVRATLRHFDLSPDTFYTWLKRYNPYYLPSLEDRSRRPKHYRQSANPWQITDLTKILRKYFPTWSKDKLSSLFRNFTKLRLLIDTIEDREDQQKGLELLSQISQIPQEKLYTSSSTIGRIIKKKGFFFAKIKSHKVFSSRKIERQRADKSLRSLAPGSLIQIDVKHLWTPWNRRYYQFTAIDCKTRIKFAKCYPSLSSKTAKLFLLEAQQFFPFLIQNIQTDNGSEFLKYFHQALKEIKHYFSYPYCPKDNCFVERVIQTDKYEFYLNGNLYTEITLQNEKLAKWNYIYNYLRPHQALGNLSPMEYYEKIKDQFPNLSQKLSNQLPFIIVNQT
jgi:transposase InsO family protein